MACFCAGEEPDSIRNLNLWLEEHIDAHRGGYPRLLWTNGDAQDGSFAVYPFRPLFADHFEEDTKRKAQWFHRSERDSAETSVWDFHHKLNAEDAMVRTQTEAWLCHGYLLHLWGTRMARKEIQPFPAGAVRDRMERLTRQIEARLHAKRAAGRLVQNIRRLEQWLTPPEGTPISSVVDYFDQGASGHYGFIPVEFVYPMSWHVPRLRGRVSHVVKHYEEDGDYDCNMLLGGLGDEGDTEVNAWLVEVYLHHLCGQRLITGQLPPWLSVETQKLAGEECVRWMPDIQTFVQKTVAGEERQ